MVDRLRLTWRLHRWELAILIGGTLLLAAACAFVAWQVGTTGDQIDACYRAAGDAPLNESCLSAIQWSNTLGTVGPMLQGAATVAPFAVGILFGAPLVSREIEHRNASIAWSLSVSRVKWLLRRGLPVVLLIALSLLILGEASSALIARRPDEVGFRTFGMHGPILAARGVAVFAVALFVGLLVGRVLPAILLSAVIVFALFVGLDLARGQMMRAEATWLDGQANNDSIQMVYDAAFLDSGGRLVTQEEAFALYPYVMSPTGSGLPPGMTLVYLATPPDRYPIFVAREIGALGVVAILAGGAALLLVRSRRPE